MSSATFISLENTRTSDNFPDGNIRYYYFGFSRLVNDEPQAFGVNESASERTAHFHPVDQFAVIFGKSDSMFEGRNTGELLAHYTDAGTVYGPFGGTAAYFFLTLRRHGTDVNGHLPEDKDKQPQGGPRRAYQALMGPWLHECYPVEGVSSEAFIEPQPDGLCAYKVALSPGATFLSPSASGSGGQYHVVVEGEVHHDDAALPRLSVGWATAGDEPTKLVAGSAGARLLILQFGAN